MSAHPLNLTVGDVLDGVKACGRGDGADGTPYGALDIGLAAGLPSAVILVLLLAIGYRYLDALRDMLRMSLDFLSRSSSASSVQPGGQNEISFDLPVWQPPVGQGPAPGVPVLSESVLVDLMPNPPVDIGYPVRTGVRWV